MPQNQEAVSEKARLQTWLGTLAIALIYVMLMGFTNTLTTTLDDEANSIAIAGRPVASALRPFLGGDGYRELHPPAVEIIWHFWLVATHSSFALLRLPANILFIGALILTARSSKRLAGNRAYWTTLIVGCIWPFAFQYGRIAGWYTLSPFLLALVTWIYLQIIDDCNSWLWVWFAAACVVFVWSNYFGFVFLLLLLADFVLFHRALAVKHLWPALIAVVVVCAAFLPLLRVASMDVGEYVGSAGTGLMLKREIASVSYPSFAIFGSAAVAPWFLPLSIPIAVAAALLVISIWFSPGRRWLIYVMLAMLAMELARVFDIKRVLIFLPWLFVASAVGMFGNSARYSKLARYSVAVIIIAGWIGIASGKHYSTTNLHEPWKEVAHVVAEDARQGATIVSENPPFFFYLDYALGLQSEMKAADGADLGDSFYRSHGFTILEPDHDGKQAKRLRGKVVLVNGSGMLEDVEAMNSLSTALSYRCAKLGEYHAASDPAIIWKQRFTTNVPLLAYRTNVTWYDCR